MYSKILVPLDGSELAECSLEHVKEVATGCHVPEVVLMAVVEPASEGIPGFWGAVAGAQTQMEAQKKSATTAAVDYDKMRAEQLSEAFEKKQGELAAIYVTRVAERLMKEGLNVTTCVLPGKAADTIIDYAAKNGVDLIVMATQGRGGETRWDFGKVADRVIRASSVPVLIASPKGCRI
jgi:nucleotide-binding universal stress UspA family protein